MGTRRPPRWFVPFALIGLFAFLLACSSTETTGNSDSSSSGGSSGDNNPIGSGENPASIGASLSADGLTITLNSVEKVKEVGFFEAPAGKTWLLVDVTIKNTSQETRDFNELYWSAKDTSTGYTYDDTLLNYSDRPLGSGSLSPGDLIRGQVVIEVDTNATRIRFKYDTSPIGGKNMYWAGSMSSFDAGSIG